MFVNLLVENYAYPEFVMLMENDNSWKQSYLAFLYRIFLAILITENFWKYKKLIGIHKELGMQIMKAERKMTLVL